MQHQGVGRTTLPPRLWEESLLPLPASGGGYPALSFLGSLHITPVSASYRHVTFLCVCVFTLSAYKDTSLSGLGPTLMTST